MKFRRFFLSVCSLFAMSVNAHSQGFSDELKCLNSILDYRDLMRGEHRYTIGGDAVLKSSDRSIIFYPVEDLKNAGTFYFYTASESFKYKFKFPSFDYKAYEKQLTTLEEESEANDKKTSEVAKEEGLDSDKMMEALKDYSNSLDANLSDEEVRVKMEAKIEEILSPYRKSYALFKEAQNIDEKMTDLKRNPPWGAVGASLGNYELDISDGMHVQIVPIINREFYGIMHDGPPWRDVKLTSLDKPCDSCTKLDLKAEAREHSEKILSEDIANHLDLFWDRIVKNPYGNLLEMFIRRGNKEAVLAWRAKLTACSALDGSAGQKAKGFIAKIDEALGNKK
jgi:hypothetical protein